MDVAKQYAERNRQGSEWFSHDAGKHSVHEEVAKPEQIDQAAAVVNQPALQSSPLHTEVASPVKEPARVEQLSSPQPDIVKHEPAIISSPVSESPKPDVASIRSAKSPASSNASTPSKVAEATRTPESANKRTQMIKPKCDSNQWFKGENGSGDRMRPQATGKKIRPVSQPVDWFTHDATKHADSAAGMAKMRLTDDDGAAYCRRDKMGSSNAWFGHNPNTTAETVTPRVTSREGASNANRMRGESENWFSHGGNAGTREPVHVSKGRVAGRPQSNEMYGVFHHGN